MRSSACYGGRTRCHPFGVKPGRSSMANGFWPKKKGRFLCRCRQVMLCVGRLGWLEEVQCPGRINQRGFTRRTCHRRIGRSRFPAQRQFDPSLPSRSRSVRSASPCLDGWRTCWNEGGRCAQAGRIGIRMIEKSSTDCQIPAEFIASLDTAGHSWIDDILCGISRDEPTSSSSSTASETVRELARSGHVVLVGHGSTYMTHDLPQGIARSSDCPDEFPDQEASPRGQTFRPGKPRRILCLDKRRRAFFAQFWPGRPLRAHLKCSPRYSMSPKSKRNG